MFPPHLLSKDEAFAKLGKASDDARELLGAMVNAVQHFEHRELRVFAVEDVFDHARAALGWDDERCTRTLLELERAGIIASQRRGPES